MASHWPCVTDNSGITTYGLTALEREMSTRPTLLCGTTHFAGVDACVCAEMQTMLSPVMMVGPSSLVLCKPVILSFQHCACIRQGQWSLAVYSADACLISDLARWKVSPTCVRQSASLFIVCLRMSFYLCRGDHVFHSICVCVLARYLVKLGSDFYFFGGRSVIFKTRAN